MIGQCRASYLFVKFDPWGVVGVVEVAPSTGFVFTLIVVMHFQGTSLEGGYSTEDDCVGSG